MSILSQRPGEFIAVPLVVTIAMLLRKEATIIKLFSTIEILGWQEHEVLFS